MSKDFSNNIRLIEALKEGDINAYNFIVDLYHHKLCIYANALAKDFKMAEDIVQNVFLKLWGKKDKLNPDFSIKNFLYKMVYNEFVDKYRKRYAAKGVEEVYIQNINTIATDETETESFQNLIQLVKKEIEELPPKCREVFKLSKEEGLTNKEISDYLNISPKTVEAQITKAFKILKTKLIDKKDIFLYVLFTKRFKNLKLS